MNKFYKILMEFTNGTTPCKTHLIRRYGMELFEECLRNDYIVAIGTNPVDEMIYTITEKGRQKRDN